MEVSWGSWVTKDSVQLSVAATYMDLPATLRVNNWKPVEATDIVFDNPTSQQGVWS